MCVEVGTCILCEAARLHASMSWCQAIANVHSMYAAPPMTEVQSHSSSLRGTAAPTSLFVDAGNKHAPASTFHMTVRAQPPQPAAASPLSLLSAGNGMLFAAPTLSGGLAVYAKASTKITVRASLQPFWSKCTSSSNTAMFYFGNLASLG
jgi:hypothetical protein